MSRARALPACASASLSSARADWARGHAAAATAIASAVRSSLGVPDLIAKIEDYLLSATIRASRASRPRRRAR